MTLLGMDVDGVSVLASDLGKEGVAIENVTQGVDAIVGQSLNEWFGPDAKQFAEQWYAQHKPALVQAQQAIGVLVAALQRNIAEQQTASAATPTASATAPAPTLGGRTPDGLLDVEQRATMSTAGPSDLKGLLGLVDTAYTQPGGVAVTFVGSGDHRRAIVAISGTENWLPGSSNVDDISTNLTDVANVPNLKQEAIAQAMRDAGVTSTDDVLLVGHSQGGADAVNFAANPALASQYHITGVMTAGAPETMSYPKLDVPVLQVRTPGDVVPALGLDSGVGLLSGGPVGMAVAGYLHDASVPGNVDIVNMDGPWHFPGGAHAMTNYESDIAASTNPAVTQFAQSQHEYLTGEQSTTYVYSANRTHYIGAPTTGGIFGDLGNFFDSLE